MAAMKEYIENNRMKLGITLMLTGIIPMFSLMAYIVYKGTADLWLMGVTVGFWAIFFAGKTLVKVRPQDHQEDALDSKE